ncbi:MAG: RNB domain-containing ribonuclease [Actinomycetota bacterium]|nr:RNB domain-containing ribonuclease [Actinomycetota bacterium]
MTPQNTDGKVAHPRSDRFGAIRAEFDLPPYADTDDFPDEAEAEAKEIAALEPADVEDATHIPFVTIDPPGAQDLDQAMFLERVGAGFRVHYAIADLGSAIQPGGAVDTEARKRGQTIYLPDARVPLHPPLLSEDALSLLPDQVRRAAVWTIDVGADGTPSNVTVRRALVRSIAQFDYDGVQATFDAGNPHTSVEPLADLGGLRLKLRVSLGAIELGMPERQIVAEGDEWRIRMRTRTQVDAWNAEISLLTGMCAAELMLEAGIGVLRTLPPPEVGAIDKFRRTTEALGVPWWDGATAGEILTSLDPELPVSQVAMSDATRLLRGVGYEAFDGSAPRLTDHAGIGGPYSHVTAPLRRLADRFGTEVCLALCAGTPVPDWVREALPQVPAIMSESDQFAAKVDRACLDQVETWMLDGKVGEVFDAFVLRVSDDRQGGEIVLTDPPVIATCAGANLPEGERVSATLIEVDADARSVSFALTDPA